MAARRKQCAGGLNTALKAFVLGSRDFACALRSGGRDTGRVGIRSITGENVMSTSTLRNNGTVSKSTAELDPAFFDSVVPGSKLTNAEFTEAVAELKAANERRDSSPPDCNETTVSLRDRVHECFETVAMGCICTLAMLLEATRAEGIDDDDVQDVISADETSASTSSSRGYPFRCFRTESGQLFIERESGVGSALASSNELFAEVRAVNEKDCIRRELPVDDDAPPAEEHTDIVLKAFEHVAMVFSVTLSTLLRECRRRGLTDDQAKAALIELENFGECECQCSDRQLFAKRTPSDEPFIYRADGTGERIASMRELFSDLDAQRGTPGSSMDSPERLFEAVVLEFAQTLNKQFKNETLAAQIRAAVSDSETDHAELLAKANERYAKDFSPLACRFIAMFWACTEVHQARLVKLFKFCVRHGMTQRDVRRAIGELHACEYVFIEWCENTEVYWLTVANLDTVRHSMPDMLVTFDEIWDEVAAT